MPFSPTKIFLEETSLVARPIIPFPELKLRLEKRMQHLGLKVRCSYCLCASQPAASQPARWWCSPAQEGGRAACSLEAVQAAADFSLRCVLQVLSIEEEEFCAIPMGGVLPMRPQRVIGIGGTAGGHQGWPARVQAQWDQLASAHHCSALLKEVA